MQVAELLAQREDEILELKQKLKACMHKPAPQQGHISVGPSQITSIR